MLKRIIACLGVCLFSVRGISQSPETLQVREYCNREQAVLLKEYFSFLAIPNVASDTAGLRKNRDFIMDRMQRTGLQQVQLLYPVTKDAPPAIYGERMVPGAVKTLFFYAHYDGQPVRAAEWSPGLDPFRPIWVNGVIGQNGKIIPDPDGNLVPDPEWRIYARSASDDKAGVAAILYAYEALVKTGAVLSCNLKFFFEGEEEASSPHLQEILQRYTSLLQSDCWIFCDGPLHPSGKKEIVFGVRGDAHLDLTVYGAKRTLHSGHYGNWAPSPALLLVKLLASMKDDNGKVTIKGFYDDVLPLSEAEKKAYRDLPRMDGELKKELGIIRTEMKGKTLEEALVLPSLNINGIQSGNVGKLATNSIPATATCVLDLRMVPGNDWKRQQQKVIDHIIRQGYFVTEKEPTEEEREKFPRIVKINRGDDGYNAQRTPLDWPLAQSVTTAVKSTTTEPVVLLPQEGGSLPLFLFEKYLQAKTLIVPVANYDNNQHAADENIRWKEFLSGIETMAALMRMK